MRDEHHQVIEKSKRFEKRLSFSTIDEREFFSFLCKTRVGRPRGRRLVVHEGEIEIQLGREAREQEEDGFGGRRGGKSERAREKENRSAAE